MDSLDAQVLVAARRWAADGHRYALVTVVRTWGSSPRPPGAWLILRDDGLVQGSVSGGCIEDDLVRRMTAGEFRGTTPEVVRYGETPDEARRFGLPCGGTLELVIEPAPESAVLKQLSEAIAGGRLVRRRLDLASGRASIEAGDRDDDLLWDGKTLVTAHGPQWRLLIVGAAQVSRYLAGMALALDYRVFICDPRSEYADEWDVPDATLLPGMPDDAVVDLALDSRSAVVALTHDPKLDDMVLLEALRSPAFYVGALGSRANNERRRERLRDHFDFTPTELQRLRGPAGLAIGSRTPPEIALSILAEITAVRHGVATVAAMSPAAAA